VSEPAATFAENIEIARADGVPHSGQSTFAEPTLIGLSFSNFSCPSGQAYS
jgi:hypothetical protein